MELSGKTKRGGHRQCEAARDVLTACWITALISEPDPWTLLLSCRVRRGESPEPRMTFLGEVVHVGKSTADPNGNRWVEAVLGTQPELSTPHRISELENSFERSLVMCLPCSVVSFDPHSIQPA